MCAQIEKPHIGIFDSGVGGLTVVQHVFRLLPHESIVYFGDTARLPYGGKSRETIIRYSIENAIFLMEKNIKALVIACNTASSYARDRLQQIFNLPVIGTIGPGAARAVQVTHNGRIGILGTKATIASGSYQQEIGRLLPDAILFPIACPLLVPLVEENFMHHEATQLIIRSYLEPLKDSAIDTLLLGCTHYPLLKEQIQDAVGADVTLVDSAAACAEALAEVLEVTQLAVKQRQGEGAGLGERGAFPKHSYFVSDDPEKFQNLGRAFLGEAMPLGLVLHSDTCS